MTATHAAHLVSRILEALSVPALVATIGIASACGGGGGGTSGGGSPTGPSAGGAAPPPSATITIGSGVTPTDLRIETGETVRFVNNSSQSREIKSDPHPTHGSCPPIDRAGALAPGASAVVGPFTLSGTCYYHDHNEPENPSFRGQIRIAVDNAGPGPIYIQP